MAALPATWNTEPGLTCTRCGLQVEQEQQVLTRKQEQAAAAQEVLAQLKASPEAFPARHMEQFIVQQNESLYIARILQVTHCCLPTLIMIQLDLCCRLKLTVTVA